MELPNAPEEEDVEWRWYDAPCPRFALGRCADTYMRLPIKETCDDAGYVRAGIDTSAPLSSTVVVPPLSLSVLDELVSEEYNKAPVLKNVDETKGNEETTSQTSVGDNVLSTLRLMSGACKTTEELRLEMKQLESLMGERQLSPSLSLEEIDDANDPASMPLGVNDSDDLLSECLLEADNVVLFRTAGEESVAPRPTVVGSSFALLINQNSALAMVRSKVSQLKRRYQKDGFDLDLTYITARVIAMSFPAWGTEKYYRNPINQVERFLESKHGGHYRIYNLCSERPEYDSPKRFQGKYKRFPFDDHNAPCPISLVLDFLRDTTLFLEQNTKNVVVVHCKAGKGRTGVMVSCLLRLLDPINIPDAEEALRAFDKARTYDGLGVTVPSQRRYVHYYDRIVQEFGGNLPPSRRRKLYQITIDSDIKLSGPVDVYLTVEEDGALKIDSRQVFPGRPKKDPKGFLFFFEEEPALQGDLRFTFYQRHRLVDKELFHFWLNTSLCSSYERLSLKDRQLDGRPSKAKTEEQFCRDLAANVIFVD
ncbi:putative tyrosine phosphatase [Trypanosoma rangeli]|uniref:Phosphatidylinositol 3,4,5-trisphosphate 3-phosphatase and dual-specificity protein phosphatase PTEN n=1 Tax=Trypanosoma rangeli TaxID=5698 RepID=A0A422N4J0_TRYRA|nr:putative tyrosine phosphatase [Trypanosoma rangeli]RNF00376.1 putative tyrosine phosphatase [Trypanosoma rangeli]|eukprot:RNF00376.1 putative tyrosine phosphatase [Trypanosoma rangeli]